jgi:hypothetical protein
LIGAVQALQQNAGKIHETFDELKGFPHAHSGSVVSVVHINNVDALAGCVLDRSSVLASHTD